MAIRVPKGIVKLPWSLTELTTGITLTDSVADIESEIVSYQIPRNMSVAFKKGDRIALYCRTAVPADITAGTIRIYIADANKATKFKVWEGPLKALMCGSSSEVFNVDDNEKRALLPAGFSRAEDEFILITFTGSDVVDDAHIALLMEGTQFIKV